MLRRTWKTYLVPLRSCQRSGPLCAVNTRGDGALAPIVVGSKFEKRPRVNRRRQGHPWSRASRWKITGDPAAG